MSSIAILDVDGTLVDTNYHHAMAWYRGFRAQGITLPLWRIHRHIGMGGDHMVSALVGEQVEEERGDDIRAAEKDFYKELINEVEPLEGARDLIVELKERGHTVVLASSAKEEELNHYLDLLDAREIADAWTDSSDVESTKPDPDLVRAAVDKGGGGDSLLVGDSTWDFQAAKKAGVVSVAVLTGGFSEAELREAGAVQVFEQLEKLIRGLDELPFP